MPDRRRLALVVTPLLALLAALLLGASAASAQDASGDAGALPYPLTLESATPTSLTVTWDAVAGATLYDVRWRAPDGIFGPDQATTATRYVITGLSPGSPYVVRVHAIGAGGATVKQLRGDFRTTLTAPPTLTVTATSTTSLTLAWTKPAGWTPAGYRLSWRPLGGTPFQGSVQLAAGVRTRTITGLTPGTQYRVRVTALNAAGAESPATGVTATAREAGPAGALPLTLESAALTALTVTWDAVAGATRYDVRWRPPDGIFGPDEAATGTRHAITGLSPGRPYVVRVHAIGAGGGTLRQFRGDFRTLLTAPAALTVTAASATSLTVQWSAPSGWSPSGYLLSWRSVGGTPFQGSAQLAAGVRTRTITGLSDGTKYLVRLTALNAAGAESPPERVTATAADAAVPPAVTLTSSRDVCTANTLTELTWTITGGKPPYTLTIDGETVDHTAESLRLNCGPLPETPPSSDLVQYRYARGFRAEVTDARGVTAAGRDLAEVVPPLPAPTGLGYYAHRTELGIWWDRVAAAGAVPGDSACPPCPLYLVRWRVSGAGAWATALHWDGDAERSGPGRRLYDLTEGTAYEWAVAALRNAIEQETPAALVWSAPVTAATVAPPTGVRATATHDTITVTWDPQPAADRFYVSLRGPHGSAYEVFRSGGTTQQQVVFRHLPSETEYTASVSVPAPYESPRTEITVSTTAAPPGWTPLPRGPQNLRTSVTHDSVTVDWDAPHADANDVYHVFLFHTGADREPTAADRREHKLLYGAGVTQHTFTGLAPATTYRVAVRHPDIVSGRVEVAATTLAAPAARSTVPVETECFAPHPISLPEILDCEPARTPVLFHWPLAYNTQWRLTEDIWDWRGNRFHAGLDVLAYQRTPVYAVADGTVRVFNNQRKRQDDGTYVDDLASFDEAWYCPEIVAAFDQQFVYTEDIEGTCNYVVHRKSGRTALIFHGDGRMTKYSHLDSWANPMDRDDRTDGVQVRVGDKIGEVGKSSSDTSTGVHLHFEIRDMDDRPGDWENFWYDRHDRFVICGSDSGYCAWHKDRWMASVLDPEALLPVLPASLYPTGPLLDKDRDPDQVNEERRAFEIISLTPPETGEKASLEFSVGIWRPLFYDENTYVDPARKFLPGVRGTRAGVTAYRVATDCPAGTRIAVDGGNLAAQTFVDTSDTDGGGADGEVPRARIQQLLAAGESCRVAVYSLNPTYEGGYAGRLTPADTENAEWPAATFEMRDPSEASDEIDGTLANFDMHFYVFSVPEGDSVDIRVDTGTIADVVLELWGGTPQRQQVDIIDGPGQEEWSVVGPVGGRSYVLMVRGGYYPRGASMPSSGTYTLTHNIPRLLAKPTDVRVTGRTSDSATVAWRRPQGGDDYSFEGRVNAGGDPFPIGGTSAAGAAGAAELPLISHPFTGLTPKTKYDLYVRSTGPNGARSNWVSVSATTFPSPPVVTSFALDSDGHPSVSFTWGEPPTSPYFLVWELHRADSEAGTYTLHTPTKSLSKSPVSFGERAVGWYKARGQVCIRDGTEPIGGATGATDNPLLTCGEWTAFTSALEVAADTTLSALTLSGVTLAPAFASGTLEYTGSVGSSVSQTTVTATATDSTATVAISPTDADTNTTGHQVNLASGATTTITVTVTAANDGPTSSYTVAITRASPPAPPTLSALSLSGVTLAPSFASTTLTYTGSVLHTVSQTTVTATATDSTASVAITPADADTNTTGHQVNLTSGATTTITVTVTAANGGPSSSYTVAVTRDESSDPAVTIAAGTSPVMEGTAAEYTVTRTGDTTDALTVTVSVSETGSMISGTKPTSVEIAAASATGTLSVATVNDSTDEPDSTITATIQAGTGYTAGTSASASVVVKDDDPNVMGRIRARTLSNGNVEFEFRTTGGVSIQPAPLRFVTPSTMVAGRWYNSSSFEVTIDGVTYTVGQITVRLDNDQCPHEIVVALRTPDGQRINPTGNRYEYRRRSENTWARSSEITIPLTAPAGGAAGASGESMAAAAEGYVATPGTVGGTMLDRADGGGGVTGAATAPALCAPLDVAVSADSSSALTLTWTAVPEATGHQVKQGAAGTELPATGGSYDFTGLTPETSYTLYVRSTRGTEQSDWASVTETTLADTTLSALTLSGVTLAPAFASGTLKYTGSVGSSVSRTTVTATATDSTATVSITPTDADTNTTGHQVNLASGATTTITVTVADGVTSSAYMVTVCRPRGRPATTGTDVSRGDTRWTYPVNGITDGERETTRQPQSRTVTWDADDCEWDTGPWQDDGDATVTWEPTGTSMTAPAMPPVMRLVNVSDTRNAASGCGDTESRSGSRKDTRSVNWGEFSMTWSEGVWVLGTPDWGDWVFTQGPRPTKPAETQTVTAATETRWTYPSGGKTDEERRTSTQAQERTVTWDASDCAWDPGDWEDVGNPVWGNWAGTGTSTDAPAKPKTTRTVDLNETRDAASGCGDTESRTGTREDTRTVGWNASAGAWNTPGDWVLGVPDWDEWVFTQGARPDKPIVAQTIPTSSATQWVVSGGTATQQRRTFNQPQIRSVTWSGAPDCEWDTTTWTNFGTGTWTAWADTGTVVESPPPGTDVVNTPTGTQTRWVTDSEIPFCILWEEERQIYWTTISPYTWSWSSTNKGWYKVTHSPLFQGTTYGDWTRTGDTNACAQSEQDDGAEGEAASVALAAGDYTLPWGLQRISFTVPENADVQLTLRALESGVQAVVLTSAADAELVLYPGALADGARPSPSAADTTLSAIAATLALTTVERVAPPTPPADEACAVVTAAESGATAVDMDASLCAVVPTGALSVTVGGQTLSLTLPTGYDWLLLRVSPDPAVLGIIDLGSGAYLALDAATGAEQSREVGEDVAATIGPLFDAIVTSAQPPPAGDDGS